MLVKNCNFTGIVKPVIVRYLFSSVISAVLLCSCASYKQNIMFKATEDSQPEIFKREAISTEKNYVIQKNDLLKLDVSSNNGERLVDPNPDLSNQGGSGQQPKKNENLNFLVDLAGTVKLPLVGEMKLEGLTLHQAEEIIQKEYSKYFKESFVLLSYVNKRVIVLGAPGGQVIPLNNQNITVAEVLALAKGVSNDAKANKIKLIRNNHVYQIDFSTIKGFLEGNLIVESGDIVYVEPIRRPFSEAIRDNYFLVSFLFSAVTVLVVVLK
jgi:polysaccharide export outer membrane protein